MLLIIWLTFILKNAVPGDYTESMLALQGISTEQEVVRKEAYIKTYTALNQHLPLFYFSILPVHYPDNIRSVSDPEKRRNLKELLNQGFQHTHILRCLDYRDKVMQSLLSADVDNNERKSISAILIKFPNDIAAIRHTNARIKHKDLAVAWNNFRLSIDNMISESRTSLWPRICWFGSENQFHLFVKQIIGGDFGISMKDGKPVVSKLTGALKWTVVLVLFSLFVALIISIPAGLLSGKEEESRSGFLIRALTMFFYSFPVFWLATLAITFFANSQVVPWLQIFPTPGNWYMSDRTFWQTFGQYIHQLILPVICLAIHDAALLTNMVRINTVTEKSKTYAKAALAKGLNTSQVLYRHILPNVSIQIISLLAGMVPSALAGSLVIELMFNIPGMGRLMVNSIYSQDWNVVFGALMVFTVITMVFNLVADLAYAYLNPKIKLS
jgi:peptide/nickel transport system permease protein